MSIDIVCRGFWTFGGQMLWVPRLWPHKGTIELCVPWLLSAAVLGVAYPDHAPLALLSQEMP